MTEAEWADLALQLWQWCWPYGTQQDRAELLLIKARIEAAANASPLGEPEVPHLPPA